MIERFTPALALPLALPLALALALAAPMARASSDMPLSPETKAQISQKLTDEGYQVGKIKIEDGYYEAYAKKDGKKLEILLDAQLNIVRVEEND
ncbi:MAG: PepSY domain-containing protein [Paracoccaceae bacterium]